MAWTDPYIIYRIDETAKVVEVFHTNDLKKAKYWLQYIAQPGDVLCRTPVHPKHSQKVKHAEYWQHKAASGQPSSEEVQWKQFAESKKSAAQFPEDQLGKSE